MHPFMHRKVSLHHSDLDKVEDKNVHFVLEGYLDNLPPLSTKLVRVFISSTFSDMIQERNALMEHVYYKLKNYCLEKYRLEFQLIDLRWGLREESQDDHTIIEFCIKEIENCKRLSIGPNFVALLGQKYGYRSFPSTIEAQKFEMIRDALMSSGKDVSPLMTWFKRDTNVIPNVYVMQPISSILKNFNKGDQELQEQARLAWEKTFAGLQHILRLGVLICVEKGKMSLKDKDSFFISVTEYEIQKGMLECPRPDASSLCFTRNITNLEDNLLNKRTKKFMDVSDSGVVDKDAQQMLLNLKNGKIKPLLEKTKNMDHFEITWEDPEAKNPNEDEPYLEEFCQKFESKIRMLIDKAVKNLKHMSRNSHIVEIHQHLSMCKIRAHVFKGREAIIQKLRHYLSGPSGFPLIVYGISGSGKTSLLAKCASLVKFWFPRSTPTLIVRFLGTTSHSCSIRLVLFNLCWHICHILNCDPSNIPGEYSSLVKYFQESLQKVKPDRTIVIILDSIDQLSQAHKAHNLAWLPKSLPENVHLILSTLSSEHNLVDNLKLLYGGKSAFVEVQQLGTDLGISLVQEWMEAAKRDLTDRQFYAVNEALSKCSLPLYTRLVFEEICRWSSFSPPETTVLKPSVGEIINKLFDNVEKYHGRVFVTHTLSYLTASKNGLSDVELEDVLSLDDFVLNDVFEHWLPPVRRIPPLLIPRLHDSLSTYLMEREANGVIVYYWYHRQFIAVAKERYLADLPHRYYVHSTLAHYFQGTWGGGKTKPYKCTEQIQKLMSTRRKEADQADRKVPLQPLWYNPEDRGGRTKFSYNLRKLSELPYHLIESRRFIDLHKDVLFNYSWLHSKLSAMSLQDVLSDFRTAIEAGDRDSEVSLVYNALRIGGSFVNSNPNTLAFDLLGRLLVYYDDAHLSIRSLLQQCDEESRDHSALLPLHQCYDPPRAMLQFILEDHSQVVVDLALNSRELISISRDGTLAFWDLQSGECIRTMANDGYSFGHHTKIYAADDCERLVVDCDTTNSPVFIYDVKNCLLLHSSGRRLATQKRGFLSGNILCRQKNFIDIRTGETVKSLDNFIQSKKYVVCNVTPNEKYIIIGDDFVSKLFDFDTCSLIAAFPASKVPSTIVITEDSLRAYVGYAEDCLFRVWDLDPESKSFCNVVNEFNFKSISGHRFLEGTPENFALSEIAVSPIDSDVVVLNVKRCNLVHYHVRSEFDPVAFDVKSIHATSRTCLCNVTFNYNALLVLASEKNFIHIWDAKTKLLLNSITLHSSQGFPWAVSRTNNQVATASNIHTAINVWDLDKVNFKETVNLVIYEGPVDVIACAPCVRLAFVRKVVSTNKTYKYLDSFGIDIWNVSTGFKETFLGFDSYGKLEKLEASPNGQMIALLVCSKETYVVIYNLKTCKVVCWIDKAFCKSFVISYDWEFICLHCIEGEENCTYLFCMKDGREIFRGADGRGAVFSHDNKYLLYIDRNKQILVYCLAKMAPTNLIPCDPLSILPVPVRHRRVLVNKSRLSEVWDFHERKVVATLKDTSDGGILSISKNSNYGVDGSLQVYDLENGEVVASFSHELSGNEIRIVEFVHSGEYVVWIDEFSVKVGCIGSQSTVANACTHERPVSLKLIDRGYTIILGREDGRILMMKLVIHMDLFRPITPMGRAEFLIDCDTGSAENLDLVYSYNPNSVKDCDLPRAPESLKAFMIQKSKKPHLVSSISHNTPQRAKHKRTCSTANAVTSDSKLSSADQPANNHLLNVRKGASSTSSADICFENQDSSDESLLGRGSPFIFNQRSKSMQDILSANSEKFLNQSFENLDSPATPISPRKPRSKFYAFFDKFGTRRRARAFP